MVLGTYHLRLRGLLRWNCRIWEKALIIGIGLEDKVDGSVSYESTWPSLRPLRGYRMSSERLV